MHHSCLFPVIQGPPESWVRLGTWKGSDDLPGPGHLLPGLDKNTGVWD